MLIRTTTYFFDQSVLLGKFIENCTVLTHALMETISQKCTFFKRQKCIIHG
jgi:hypothetical protein